MTPLRFRPEVAVDLSGAWAWCEARRPGLGDEFLAAVERCAERVSANPVLFAVLHARRDPGVWQTRM